METIAAPEADLSQLPAITEVESPEVIDLREARDGKPDYSSYEANARDILSTMRQPRGFMVARETYIEGEADPCLRHQAEVLVHAPAAARLEAHKEKLAHGQERDEATQALINYNHAVRDLVVDNEKQVNLDDVEGWLYNATGNKRWAEAITNGVAGEIALERLVKQLGVESVRPGNIEEDSRGMDLVAEVPDGRGGAMRLGIDAKTRIHLAREEELEERRGTKIFDPKSHRNVYYHRIVAGVSRRDITPDGHLKPHAFNHHSTVLSEYIDGLAHRRQAVA